MATEMNMLTGLFAVILLALATFAALGIVGRWLVRLLDELENDERKE